MMMAYPCDVDEISRVYLSLESGCLDLKILAKHRFISHISCHYMTPGWRRDPSLSLLPWESLGNHCRLRVDRKLVGPMSDDLNTGRWQSWHHRYHSGPK